MHPRGTIFLEYYHRILLICSDRTIFEGKVTSLKRFTEDVKEVRQGFECGIGLDNFSGFKEGDAIEVFISERVS